ncbi:MAG: DUF2946 domain-containing protein, partial [Burkholderiales bacterium]|nr:DUF2946 domain-containing protein [Burkholderiales bacterium]
KSRQKKKCKQFRIDTSSLNRKNHITLSDAIKFDLICVSLANSKSIYWTEICTTSGTKLVAIDLNTKNIPDTVSKDNHCNYCFTKNHLSVLPTSSFSWGVTELVANRLIVSFSEVNNNNRYIRSAHPPRAPPQFI